MKKKRMIIVIAILGFVIGSAIRIYWVNKGVEKQKTAYFKMNETVEFGQDFNIDSSKIMDGYSMKVLDSEVLSTEDFYKTYHLIAEDEQLMEDPLVKYYYIVKAVFSNKDNQEGENQGIDLSNLLLTGKDYSVVANIMAYGMINPNMPQGLGFSLRPNSSLEVLIPYAIIPGSIAKNEKDALRKLTKESPMLQVTSYPTKKMIEMK